MKEWKDVLKYLAQSELTATEAFIAIEKANQAKMERMERYKQIQNRQAVQLDMFDEGESV